MIILQEVIDIIIHGFIFSYSMGYLYKQKTPSHLLLVCFAFLFAWNKYIYLFSISSQAYFLFSNLFVCLILSYLIDKSLNIYSLFYSLSISIAYFSSVIFSQIILSLFLEFSIDISPTIMMSFFELVFLLFIVVILKNIKKISLEFTENKYLFISVFIVILFIFMAIFQILYKIPEFKFNIYLLLVFIVCLTILSLSLFINISHLEKEKFQETMIKQELMVKERTYYQIERSVQNLSSIRHDMLYILTHIQHLNSQQNKDIDTFVDREIEHIKANDKPILTGNQTLNYIIFENMNFIRKNHIDLVCNEYQYESPIQKIDFYTIMSILLEMVFYNIPANSQLNIKHGFIDSNYYIKIITSAIFDIEVKELKTIEATLRKYNGCIYLTKEDGIMEISIFIK